MTVNASELKFFAQLKIEMQNNPPKSLSDMTLEEYRQGVSAFINFSGPAAQVPYEELFTPARDGHLIKVRIYDPQPQKVGPILIMYPGCGYACDLFEVNCISASRIAKYSQCKVAMIDFRLAPECPLPQAIYDGYDATEYLATHAQEHFIHPNQIMIGGLSSGASCAASVALLASAQQDWDICQQILLNGCYDFTHQLHAYQEFEQHDFLLNEESKLHLFGLLQEGNVELSDPIISPVYHHHLKNLPPTTIMVGEYDGLRSQSEGFYDLLLKSGANVNKILLKGQTHNTLIMMEVLPEDEDLARIIADLMLKPFS
tara:strand:- start:193 stop:1137 length:945 start_codon:yes stop_codon:yes gene_type:complete